MKSRNQEYPSMTRAVENKVLAQVMHFKVIWFCGTYVGGFANTIKRGKKLYDV